jgi:hypothetical protein
LEKGNKWIYFIPSSESITILCPEREPIDVTLTVTGKLSIQSSCKGYSLTALLTTTNDIKVNNSKHVGDLLSKVESQFECCESLGIPRNLSHVELNMKLKHIISHVEDLKYSNFKISELENLVKEQEWKNKHTQYHKTYSTLGYIAITLMVLYGIYRLGRFILKCRRGGKLLAAITGTADNSRSSSSQAHEGGNIVNININIKTSNESLVMSPEAIPLQDLDRKSLEHSTHKVSE